MKGFLLSIDALVAVGFLLVIAVSIAGVSVTVSSPEADYQRLYMAGRDFFTIMKTATVNDMRDLPSMKYYVAQGLITGDDMSKTVMDVVGSFWSQGNITHARNITMDMLNLTLNGTAYSFELLMGDSSILRSGGQPNGSLAKLSTVVSGYEVGRPASGYVARSFLSSIRSKTTSSYLFFGGYTGDGNITMKLELPEIESIGGVYMEMDAGNNFSVYMNGNPSGLYEKGSAGGGLLRADKWTVCNLTVNPSYRGFLVQGNNTIEIKFGKGDGNYMGGGYIEVTYNTTQLAPLQDLGKGKYSFPGINGFFNLYDSIYVPGTLNSMTAYLHYFNNITLSQTNATVFLTIGNIRVFSNNRTGEQKISLSYGDLWQGFGSQQNLALNLSQKTTPIRFGMEGFQLLGGGGVGTADAVLVTDVSGSMDTDDIQPGNQQRLAVAKQVDSIFVGTVLNTSGNRVGLNAYSSSPGIRWWHSLSSNAVSLKNQIGNYSTTSATCTSCGIDNATKMLTAQSSEGRFKGILVMSDGYANQCLLGNNCGIYGGPVSGSATSLDPDYPAKLEAINMSCTARSKDYIMFSVGFGADADAVTLQRIACWNCSACRIGFDCMQLLNQSSCQAAKECYWDAALPMNNTVFFDGFEVDITTNWTVSANWARSNDQSHSGSRSAKKAASSAAGILTAKSVNTSGVDAVYVNFWYRDDDTDPNEVSLQFKDSSGNWDSMADLSSSTENRWNQYTARITDSQYFHPGFAIRFSASAFGNGENFWVDDVMINRTVNGGCPSDFGAASACWMGNVTLPNGTEADCRAVRYAQSNNVDELKRIYGNFGNMFATLSYTNQTTNITGDVSLNNTLYTDSRIEFDYSPAIIPYNYGEISIIRQSARLKDFTGDNITMPDKEGWLNISPQTPVVDAKMTSYSSGYWTDRLYVRNATSDNWSTVYWLGNYSAVYGPLGDPFIVQIPPNYISSGNNSFRIGTGFAPGNATGGSPDDRIIYEIRVKGSMSYGNVFNSSELAMEDAKRRLIDSISEYVDIDEDDVEIEDESVSGIRSLWGPSTMEVRIWK